MGFFYKVIRNQNKEQTDGKLIYQILYSHWCLDLMAQSLKHETGAGDSVVMAQVS